jgi:hypothetical protein
MFFSKQEHFALGNGSLVWFWEDRWLKNLTLAENNPNLYNIVQRKNVFVADVLIHAPLNIAFRRALMSIKWNECIHLCQRLI